MFRQLRVWARPLRMRSTVSYRQFGICPQLNFPNYGPNPGPYFYPPPKSRASRLKDIAIGSAITVGAYLAYLYYDYREFAKETKEAYEEQQEMETFMEELKKNFNKARLAGDHHWLRELSFEFIRYIATDYIEVGPLPSLPESVKPHGKEAIPEEDTLVFIYPNFDEYADQPDVYIVINAEPQEILKRALQPGDSAGSTEGILAELILRLNYQATEWVYDGLCREDQPLLISIIMRENHFTFTYRFTSFSKLFSSATNELNSEP
ncbi:hypothetical protein F4804DRAFT_331015 [Jackrogersella minutella]|nr:hypothetical protein F4804DRAFT_331015 [Jackrogersella minutella]